MSNYVNELERESNDIHYALNQLECMSTELKELIEKKKKLEKELENE